LKNIVGGCRAGLVVTAIAAAALCSAPAALAKTTSSSNWAGYAVHHPNASFRQVSGTWTQPGASCVSGESSYSAVWVGIGGYKPTAPALEQIGTEVDCNASGTAVLSAWYELVPAPSKTISLAVHPGDVMHATVTVVGHGVTLDLEDLTSHRSFTKSLTATTVDVSSAEWIVEAPSECISQFACQALPLANFGSVTFDSASVTSARGITGSIINPRWWRTKINLIPGAERFIVARRASSTAGSATPSALTAGGSQFAVAYSALPVAPQQFAGARRSSLRAAYVEH
jgi:Peptidase A4 family